MIRAYHQSRDQGNPYFLIQGLTPVTEATFCFDEET